MNCWTAAILHACHTFQAYLALLMNEGKVVMDVNIDHNTNDIPHIKLHALHTAF